MSPVLFRLWLWRSCAVLLCAVAFCGCRGVGEGLADVSGTVTFYGLPTVAEITFQPQNAKGEPTGRASTAFTDESGYFRLDYNDESHGAAVGTHQVTIKVLDIVGGKHADDGRANTESTSRIKVVRLQRKVSDGANKWDFALTH